MTDKIQQARRAAFEAWVTAKWPHMPLHRRDALPIDHERYGQYVHFEPEWQAWNAALDSISIELPDCTEFDFPSGAAPAIEDCRAAIEQTGLGIKVND